MLLRASSSQHEMRWIAQDGMRLDKTPYWRGQEGAYHARFGRLSNRGGLTGASRRYPNLPLRLAIDLRRALTLLAGNSCRAHDG